MSRNDNSEIYDPELPPGFSEVEGKYSGHGESLASLWDLIDSLRDSENDFARFKAQYLKIHGEEAPPGLVGVKNARVRFFRERIIKAVINNDRTYLDKLRKALELPTRPEEPINDYIAAVQAFHEIYLDGERSTQEEWPTKGELRARTNEILHAAGHPPVSDRHWPRVLKTVGLSGLPTGGLNRY